MNTSTEMTWSDIVLSYEEKLGLSDSRTRFAVTFNLSTETLKLWINGSVVPPAYAQRLFVDTAEIMLSRNTTVYDRFVKATNKLNLNTEKELANALDIPLYIARNWLNGEDTINEHTAYMLETIAKFNIPFIKAESIDFPAVRKQFGLNKKDFASYFHISAYNLSNWEKGKFSPPKYINILINSIIEFEKENHVIFKNNASELFEDANITYIDFKKFYNIPPTISHHWATYGCPVSLYSYISTIVEERFKDKDVQNLVGNDKKIRSVSKNGMIISDEITETE